MAHIPQFEIERLKKEISVQRLAEARGIKLRRAGKELIGLCPFHDDRNPSLNIDPAKNEWHCKGACSQGGDVIKWVMRSEGVGFRHAVELLKKNYAPTPGPVVKQSTVPKLPSPVTMGADDQKVMKEVVRFYNQTLRETPDALAYMEKRGLKSAEIIEHFHLGFSNRMLGPSLPDRNRRPGAAIREQLERLGIIREESGHEHLRGSLVVPVMNLDGDVVQLYGRKITPNLRAGTPDHLYLPGPMRGVWNEQAFVVSKEIILCEALIDALTFWCAGYRHVTTSYGVNGFTDEHRAALKKHGTERVYIAYDADDAGNKAAVKLAEELMQTGVECFRVEFPKGMDANAYALKTQPAALSLGILLNKAAWLGKGSRPEGRVAIPIVERKPTAEEQAAKEKNIEPAEVIAPASPAPNEEPAQWFEAAKQADEQVLPLAAVVASGPRTEVRGEDVMIWLGDREYRVRGLAQNTSPTVLKVNLRVLGMNAHGDMALHVDTLEMSSSRQRMAFSKQAAEELHCKESVIHGDLSKVLMELELLRDAQIAKALAPKEPIVTMTEEERSTAMELLCSPRLVERIVEDFERCGVVGEETNKLVGYLGVVSRHLERPLAVIVQSSSAAGKSSLMDAVLAFVPEERRVQYSAMTGQSLFYMGETNLKNKVLAVVEEEGASRAEYALKLLQSEGELTIASTGKDPVSGRHITHEYKVEGPVMLFLTTTGEIDDELQNRCIVLTVNEDREQTQAIHRMQRESQTLAGLLRRKDRDELRRLHRNAQRLLRPLEVVNELALELSFPDSMTRTRRDHTKYLTLIRSIAFLHQHQREVKTYEHNGKLLEYIETTEADVELAKKLIHEVLGHSLDDMQSQTRKLLTLIDSMVKAACEQEKIERAEHRFSRRDVRAFTRWSDSQLKRHMKRLEELEYLIVHRGGRGQSFVYELFFEAAADAARSTLPGLEHSYDGEKSGLEAQKSGGGLGQVRGMSGGSAVDKSSVSMRLPASLLTNPLEITSTDGAEQNRIVGLPPRSMNGNGHRGGTTWPA
jgi:DNA primase catalytic core